MNTRSTCPDCGRAVRYREYFSKNVGTYDGMWVSQVSIVCRGCGRRLWFNLWSKRGWFFSVVGWVGVSIIAFGTGQAVQPRAWRDAARAAGSPCWWFGDAVDIGLLALGVAGLIALLPWYWPHDQVKAQDDGAALCWRCRFDMRDRPAGLCTECGAALGYVSRDRG